MVANSTSEGDLEDSEVFHILGNDRRRAIVELLAEGEGESIEVSDVATTIADAEAENDTVPNNLYKSVYVSLQQTHLPQLEEDDVVVYDSDAKEIRPGSNFDRVLSYINGATGAHAPVLSLHVAVSIGALIIIAVAGIVDVLGYGDLILLSVVAFVLIAGSALYGLVR